MRIARIKKKPMFEKPFSMKATMKYAMNRADLLAKLPPEMLLEIMRQPRSKYVARVTMSGGADYPSLSCAENTGLAAVAISVVLVSAVQRMVDAVTRLGGRLQKRLEPYARAATEFSYISDYLTVRIKCGSCRNRVVSKPKGFWVCKKTGRLCMGSTGYCALNGWFKPTYGFKIKILFYRLLNWIKR
jgi:hypothetical protein